MSKKALLLKVVPANMTTRNGFVWPAKGPVECPDWKPTTDCGNGLHAWMWTPSCDIDCSNGYHLQEDCKWLVVKVDEKDIVDLEGKVKFKSGVVTYSGDFAGATKRIQVDHTRAGFKGTATAGYRGTATTGYRGTATTGDRGTATTGDGGTATAGYGGTATAGDSGTATTGDRGTATAGYRGTATAGDSGTATAGDGGTATAGDGGTATAGHSGTATAGDGGTATAGHSGTATAGYSGIATAGYSGIATAGYGGILIVSYIDKSYNRRKAIAEVGQTPNILPNTPYKVDNAGNFIEVKK